MVDGGDGELWRFNHNWCCTNTLFSGRSMEQSIAWPGNGCDQKDRKYIRVIEPALTFICCAPHSTKDTHVSNQIVA